jgi:uncharacterized protein (TIGR02145 family)
LLISTIVFAQQFGMLKDSRDGRVYKTVKIGEQEWMAENLNVSKFRNGDLIPEAKTEEEWEAAGKNKKPTWCYYENNPANGIRYGKLYNWYAVNDPRGLAPNGFHIPKDAEWNDLIIFLGGASYSASKMTSQKEWDKGCMGNNSSGFSGLPGGARLLEANKYIFVGAGIKKVGGWWSSSAFSRQNINNGITSLGLYIKNMWISVETHYQRRNDLYMFFIKAIAPNANFEQSTLDVILQSLQLAREVKFNINDTATLKNYQFTQNSLQESFNRLINACKQNPEISNSKSFEEFLIQLEGTERLLQQVNKNLQNPVENFNLLLEELTEAWAHGLFCKGLDRFYLNKNSGMSVRCVKD